MNMNEVETKVYKLRWNVLALYIWMLFMWIFTIANFGYLNNIMVEYFHTTYVAVDWIVLGCIVGTIVASPIIAWLAHKKLLSCKKSMITASFLFTVGFTFIIIGFLRPGLFCLVVLGQMLSGIAAALLYAIPTSLAQLWFSESQIGLATGSSLLGISSASIVGNTLPAHLIEYPQNNSGMNMLKEFANYTKLNWFQHDKQTYQFLYLSLLVTAVIVLVLLLTVVPEKPEKPPSIAQYLKHKQAENDEGFNFFTFCLKIKELLRDYKFVACAIASSLLGNMPILVELTIELILKKIDLKNISINFEELSGFIIAVMSVGCFVANILAGILLDCFKKYYMQSILSAVFSFLSSILLFLSIYYQSLIAVIFSNFSFGLCKRTCYITLIDALMQHTYPTNPVFVMAVVVFIQGITALAFIEAGRQIVYSESLLALLIYICGLMLLVCILCVLFKPVKERLNAEESRQNAESTPFLSN